MLRRLQPRSRKPRLTFYGSGPKGYTDPRRSPPKRRRRSDLDGSKRLGWFGFGDGGGRRLL
jgi:hypothetical protein